MMVSRTRGASIGLTLAQWGQFRFLLVDQHFHGFYYQEFTLMNNLLTVNDDDLRVR